MKLPSDVIRKDYLLIGILKRAGHDHACQADMTFRKDYSLTGVLKLIKCAITIVEHNQDQAGLPD